MPAGGVDPLQVGRLLLAVGIVLVFLQQQLAVADDGVERRAQLMAHLGQEDRLGPAGLVGHVLGLAQAHGGGAVPFGFTLQLRAHGDHARVIDGHPGHVDRGRQDRDPAHRLQRGGGDDLREATVEGERAQEAAEIEGEQAEDDPGPVGQIEEAEQQGDQDPRHERRADAAVIEGTEQGGEGEGLDRDQGHELEVLGELQQERQGQEGPCAGDHRPAGHARRRIGEIEEQTHRLGHDRAEQMGEYKVSGEAELGAFLFGLFRNKPVDDLQK